MAAEHRDKPPLLLEYIAFAAMTIGLCAALAIAAHVNPKAQNAERTPRKASGSWDSFYLEASVQPILTPAQRLQQSNVAAATSQIRYWADGVDKWRWEIGPPGKPTESVIVIADGPQFTIYRPDTKTYSTGLSPAPLGSILALTTIWIGPLPSQETSQAQIDALLNSPLVRHSEILGVPVVVSEGPAHRETLTSVDATGKSVQTQTLSGLQRIYLNVEHLFIMKIEREPDANSAGVIVEATHLETDLRIPPSVFQFTPPPGSIRDNSR
jgi:outer membrane lipoprotein-sorting protein